MRAVYSDKFGEQSAESVPTVLVEITNAEDTGTVVLSPLPPQVGVPLTAVLTDEDGSLIGPGPHGATSGPRWRGRATPKETGLGRRCRARPP